VPVRHDRRNLDPETERTQGVVALCVDVVAGQGARVAGPGRNATDEANRLSRHAKASPPTLALVVLPYTNKPNQAA